ncbi:MAG: J domain-containing protein [Sphingomonadaceae bacterium]
MRKDRFHGRVESEGRKCDMPGCDGAGEFRAPGGQPAGFDGPGEWRWLCLDHVREFNAGYDWFEGMSADEIFHAQSPVAGWDTHSRAFRADAGIDGMPRWADFHDPLDAIGARAADIRKRAERQQHYTPSRFTPEEHEALEVMGLGADTDRAALRRRYSELVRRYHPDRNGGDRRYEARLGRVVSAYQTLRKSASFG